VVPEHGGAGGVAGPITAGHVFTPRERATIGLRAGEDVVHVRFVAACVDGLALLAEPGLFVDLIVVAVQIVDVFRDDDAFGVLPGPFTDAITGVDGGLAIGCASAQVSVPGSVAGADRLRQGLAVFVCARQPAQVGAFSRADW